MNSKPLMGKMFSVGVGLETTPGTRVVPNRRLDPLSESLKVTPSVNEKVGARGSLQKHIDNAFVVKKDVSGALNFLLRHGDLEALIPCITGDDDGAYAINPKTITVEVDRVAGTYLYTGVHINKTTFALTSGEGVELTLDCLGYDRIDITAIDHAVSTVTAEGTFIIEGDYRYECTNSGTTDASKPSFSGATTPGVSTVTDGTVTWTCYSAVLSTLSFDTAPAYVMDQLTLTVDATEREVNSMQIVIDRNLQNDHFMNSIGRTSAMSQDFMVTGNMELDYSADNVGIVDKLIAKTSASVAVSLTNTNGTPDNVTMTMANVIFNGEEPSLSDLGPVTFSPDYEAYEDDTGNNAIVFTGLTT